MTPDLRDLQRTENVQVINGMVGRKEKSGRLSPTESEVCGVGRMACLYMREEGRNGAWAGVVEVGVDWSWGCSIRSHGAANHEVPS